MEQLTREEKLYARRRVDELSWLLSPFFSCNILVPSPGPGLPALTQSPKTGMKDNAEGKAVNNLCPHAFIFFNLYS